MNQSTLLRSRLVHIAGPTVAILVLYMLLFHLSLARQCKQELIKLAKLESTANLSDVDTANQQLASLQSETEVLNEHLASVKRSHQTLVARQTPAIRESEGVASPAKEVADAVELLESTGLVLASSAVVPNSRSPQNDSTQGNPASPQRSHENDNREIRLRVFGTFDQVRSALSQLRQSRHLWLRSLEMEESDGLSASRNWTLTIDAMEGSR